MQGLEPVLGPELARDVREGRAARHRFAGAVACRELPAASRPEEPGPLFQEQGASLLVVDAAPRRPCSPGRERAWPRGRAMRTGSRVPRSRGAPMRASASSSPTGRPGATRMTPSPVAARGASVAWVTTVKGRRRRPTSRAHARQQGAWVGGVARDRLGRAAVGEAPRATMRTQPRGFACHVRILRKRSLPAEGAPALGCPAAASHSAASSDSSRRRSTYRASIERRPRSSWARARSAASSARRRSSWVTRA